MKEASTIRRLMRPCLQNIKPYSSARDEYSGSRGDFTFLDANENPFDNGVNRYPDPRQRQLKEILCELKGISAEHLFLGNGSDEVLDLLFRAFCEPSSDNVITLPPTYGMYGVLAGLNNVENREVLLSEGFQPNVSKIMTMQDSSSKLLFLCSPNNPTGNLMNSELVEELLHSFNGIVVIDEAYNDFTAHQSYSKRLNEFPNLAVVQTLSKAYGMAGIRLGVCLANAEIISILNAIKPPYNVNLLTQNFAAKRLSEPAVIRSEIESIIKERAFLAQELQKFTFIKKIFPSDANFLLVRVDDATLRYDQLLRKGIVVRNRSSQPGCEETLRITVGTSAENKYLVNVLEEL